MASDGDEAAAGERDFQARCWRSRDGLSLFVRDYPAGDGPVRLPVICLHGLTRNSKDFEEVAPWLAARGRRVLVPDMRGRGLSDWDPHPERYVPKTYAQDVLELMCRLGIDRAVFVGTSMGGIIEMAIAALRSRAIAAAVLNDVGPAVDPAGIARIRGYAGKGSQARTWDEATDYVRRINSAAFPDNDDEAWRGFARRTFRDKGGGPELDYDPAIMVPLTQGRYKAPGLLAWLLFRRLARRRPTLAIRGGLSDLLSTTILERMRRHAPKMHVVEVPNVGHAPTLSEPDAVSALEEFLGEVE